MAEIRGVDLIARKWASVTPARTGEYEAGVKAPRKDWAAETAAAADAYKAGVQDAIAKDRFRKGVNRVGSAEWQRGALEKGTQRWGPGVQLGEDAYRRGFAPYREAIAGVTLPPRGPRRSPNNLQRVNAVVDALVKVKNQLANA
jgi:hypothetical protein